MPSPARLGRWRTVAALVAVLALAAVALAAPAMAAKSVRVGTAQNAKLHKKVLVNAKGRTLYALSVEARKHFICNGSCLRTWHPLKLAKHAKATGVAHLGVAKHGRVNQVTYKGHPLYTFAGDTKKGQANGEGFKDVGTWHAVATSVKAAKRPSRSPSPAPMPPTGGGGGITY